MLQVADLFCGAGGASTGLLQAAESRGMPVDLVAVNHWPVAVETHTRNHSRARHYCASIETLDPFVAVPSGRLDLLIAAPECIHFSTARGGRPMSDQSRASAWHVARWLEVLKVEHLLIENVPEFQTWGPLSSKTGRPIKRLRGETFRAFVRVLESLDYRVEWRVLNAADYGGATSRQRLFLQARRGRKRIEWPAQTHSEKGGRTLFGDLKRWRGAREVIDWSVPSASIFGRKRPLKPRTIARIVEGLRRFGGPEVQPFLIQLTHGGRVRSLDDPMPTITTANRGETALVEPFLLGQQSGATARPVSKPVPTVSTGGAIALVQTILRNNQAGRSIDEPIPTITAGGGHVGITSAFLTQYYGSGAGVASIDDPVPTVTTRDRFALVQPVVDGMALDIRFRMLQPHELAAAMDFPSRYDFAGKKGDVVKQIGNAWNVKMGEALGAAILDARGSGRTRSSVVDLSDRRRLGRV